MAVIEKRTEGQGQDTAPVRCIIYAPKSTQDKNRSIDDQLLDGREMASEEGRQYRKQDALIDSRSWSVVAEYFEEGMSAYSGNRGLQFERGIQHSTRLARETGEPVMLIAQAHDRFARGAGDKPGAPRALIELWHELRRQNVWLRSYEDDGDLRDSPSVANIGHRAHMDSKRKSASVKKGGRRRAAQRGRLTGGPRPYAYFWADPRQETDSDGGTRWVRDLEVVRAEVPTVHRIYADSIAGASQKGIARALNRDGVPSATGKKWTQSSVRNVLRSPIYVGRFRHAGKVYNGVHKAIIDEPTWNAAQAIRELEADKKRSTPNRKGDLRGSAAGSNNGGGRHPNGRHLLPKGLLRCHCRSAMTPVTKPTRTPGRLYEVYQCSDHCGDVESCPQTPIKREVIDEAILREVTSRYLDLEETRERLRARRSADLELATSALTEAETEALGAGDALQRIERDYINGKINAEQWNRLEATLTEEQHAADAALERARQRVEHLGAHGTDDAEEETLRRLAELRATVLGGIENAPDLDALRRLLRQLFKEIVYQDGRLFLQVRVPQYPTRTVVRVAGLAEPVGPDYGVKAPLTLSATSEQVGLTR